MGDFGKPSVTSVSRVGSAQQGVQNSLADVLNNLLQSDQFSGAFEQLLSGTPTDFEDVERGAFRTFTEFGIPAINAQAGGLSAIQNSRRGGEIARSAGNISSALASTKAQLTESARNRQLQAILGPLGISSGFSTAGTQDTIAEPSLFGQFLGLGGTLGGAALGKGK